MTVPSPRTAEPALLRRLGTADAVVIGLGSMIGAGIFAALAPAAAAAGPALLLAVGVAGVLAYANATSTAQLAAALPVSGGAYAYGRERLGPWWGYAAGWCFVVGKTASCGAMALTIGAYAWPGRERLVAVVAVVVLVAVNTRGVTRTAQLTRVLVAITLGVLASVVVAALRDPDADLGGSVGPAVATTYGVLQGASLLFFAMAGYARIATLGEEVRNPRTTIPRAIPLALGIVVGVYLVVAGAALAVLGPERLAASSAPLADVVTAAGAPGLAGVVRVGAAVAALGALLGLIAGIGRTALAMAREGDLPRGLARVDPVHRVPQRAEVVVGVAVVGVVLLGDLATAIGFSSFAVLLYYAVANTAAFTQPSGERRWPRALQVLGLAGCVTLAVTVPPISLGVGAGLLVLGLGARLLRVTRTRRRRSDA